MAGLGEECQEMFVFVECRCERGRCLIVSDALLALNRKTYTIHSSVDTTNQML
jgi:hypothetical protein